MSTTYTKDPEDILDYRNDWSAWLAANDDDTLSASSWVFEDDGDNDGSLTIEQSSFDDDSATVWLSGGTPGRVYRLTNRIETAQSRTKDATITFLIQEQ